MKTKRIYHQKGMRCCCNCGKQVHVELLYETKFDGELCPDCCEDLVDCHGCGWEILMWKAFQCSTCGEYYCPNHDHEPGAVCRGEMGVF